MCSVGQRSTRGRATRGISLLEALAATAFVSLALLAFAGNSTSLTRNLKSADSTAAATALALQKLEQLRSMPLGAAGLAAPGLFYDIDRKSTRLNSSHRCISYAVFCLKKK